MSTGGTIESSKDIGKLRGTYELENYLSVRCESENKPKWKKVKDLKDTEEWLEIDEQINQSLWKSVKIIGDITSLSNITTEKEERNHPVDVDRC